MKASVDSYLINYIFATTIAASAITQPPTSLITPGPALELRQASSTTFDAAFLGYYVSPDGSPSAQSCSTDSAFIISGTYAECCPTDTATKCFIGSSCLDISRVVGGGYNGDLTCGTDFPVCRTQTIFSSEAALSAGSVLKILCISKDFKGESIYRDLATTTTDLTSSSTGTSTNETSSSTGISTINTVAAPTNSSNSDNNNKSKSKAWIAGPIVGPIVGFVLLGALAWFLLRRRQTQKDTTGTGSTSELAEYSGVYKGIPQAESEDAMRSHRTSELHGSTVFGHH